MNDIAPAVHRRAVLRAIAASGVLAATATVTGCGTGGQQRAAPGTVVMVIRHGEKPDKSSSLRGIDPSGRPDSSSLTRVGYARASGLVDVFDPAQGSVRPGLVRPAAIYAAGASSGGEGTRTRETVAPLAQRLGISVNTSFGKGDEDALVAQVTARPGPTLICWQHGEIPAIAQAFGPVTPAPPRVWPDNRFDVIWTFTRTTDGWDFAQIPETVLAGDQTTLIGG